MKNGLKPIASFMIDHTKHDVGFYLTTVQDISGRKIYTYDLRFRRPNQGDYLTTRQYTLLSTSWRRPYETANTPIWSYILGLWAAARALTCCWWT